MIYWAGVHCARAVHVQVVCTYCCFGASTSQTVGTGDAKLAGHMHTASTCVPLWLTLLWGASCARQRWKTFLTWGPPVYGESKLWASDTKLGTWVHLGKAYLAPYDLLGWGALCTCSARASGLHLLLFWRFYRPNGGHRWCQTCRTHAYCPNLCAFVVNVVMGCKLCAPEVENFFDVGSSGLRKLWARHPKLGTRVHFGKVYLATYDLMGLGALCTCSAHAARASGRPPKHFTSINAHRLDRLDWDLVYS